MRRGGRQPEEPPPSALAMAERDRRVSEQHERVVTEQEREAEAIEAGAAWLRRRCEGTRE